MVSTSRTYASPKGTGPGVRRSKRPLSACHTRRKCSMETTQISVKGQKNIGALSSSTDIIHNGILVLVASVLFPPDQYNHNIFSMFVTQKTTAQVFVLPCLFNATIPYIV